MKILKSFGLPIILFCALLQPGCRNSSITSSAKSSINQGLKAIEFSPQQGSRNSNITLTDVEFVKLKMPDSSGLEPINDILFSKAYIYVIQEFQFMVLKLNGELIKKINFEKDRTELDSRIVKGKVNFYTGGIDILSHHGEKISCYDALGNFKKSYDLVCPVFNFQPTENGYLFHNGLTICGNQEFKNGGSYRISTADYSNPNNIIDTYLGFRFKGLKTPIGVIDFDNFQPVGGIPDSVIVFESYCDTIYTMFDRKLYGRYVISYEGEKGKLSDIMSDASIRKKSEEIRLHKITQTSNILENDTFLSIQYSFYSNKFKFYTVNCALYDKRKQKITVFGENMILHTKIDDIPFDFNNERYPNYLNSVGKFVTKLSPSEIKQELDRESYAKELRGPMHKLVERFNLKDKLKDNRPLLLLYNIK